jgi:hypothetical protein
MTSINLILLIRPFLGRSNSRQEAGKSKKRTLSKKTLDGRAHVWIHDDVDGRDDCEMRWACRAKAAMILKKYVAVLYSHEDMRNQMGFMERIPSVDLAET